MLWFSRLQDKYEEPPEICPQRSNSLTSIHFSVNMIDPHGPRWHMHQYQWFHNIANFGECETLSSRLYNLPVFSGPNTEQLFSHSNPPPPPPPTQTEVLHSTSPEHVAIEL